MLGKFTLKLHIKYLQYIHWVLFVLNLLGYAYIKAFWDASELGLIDNVAFFVTLVYGCSTSLILLLVAINPTLIADIVKFLSRNFHNRVYLFLSNTIFVICFVLFIYNLLFFKTIELISNTDSELEIYVTHPTENISSLQVYSTVKKGCSIKIRVKFGLNYIMYKSIYNSNHYQIIPPFEVGFFDNNNHRFILKYTDGYEMPES